MQHLGGPRRIHPPAFSAPQTKPFTQRLSRAAGRETSRNTEVSSAANVPEALIEAASTGTRISQDLHEGLWAGMEGGKRQATSSRRAQHRARPPVGTATGHINLSPSICIQQSSGHGFVGSSSLIQAFVREVIAVKLSAFTSTKARVKM